MFHLSAAFGGWRVAIVDCAEDLNRSGANALLKMIEEPPPRSLILIVAHRPGRVLATIRSRCRRLLLERLSPAEIGEVVAGLGAAVGRDRAAQRARPPRRAPTARCARRCAGSIPTRRASARLIDAAIAQLPNADPRAVHKLAEAVERPRRRRRVRGADRRALRLARRARARAAASPRRARGADDAVGQACAPRRARPRRSTSTASCTCSRCSRKSRPARGALKASRAAHVQAREKCSRTAAMSANRRFYITTAIPYANGAPHIGHAYERIATDAIQRFMRLDGRETLFVTGMDEYGLKVQQTAARRGRDAAGVRRRRSRRSSRRWAKLLNARADDIVRTTQARHKRSVQAIWERMKANGDIYLSKYAGWYSVRDEAYFDESELTRRRRTAASSRRAARRRNGSRRRAISSGCRPTPTGCSRITKAQPDFITPETYRNEIVAFVKRGLADLSISRTNFDWGVPVPGDPRHVMYVWVDALTNYITATGFPDGGAALRNSGRPTRT